MLAGETNINSNPLNFINSHPPGKQPGPQADLIRLLLYQIVRVKELVKFYESAANGAGQLGASILTELVTEAYNSLVNYDTTLMYKYYDLLMNCD